MNPYNRASYRRADAEPCRRLINCAEDRPHETGLALTVSPRMKVVRNHREREADLLGATGALDQLLRRLLLTANFITEVNHQTFLRSSEPRSKIRGVVYT